MESIMEKLKFIIIIHQVIFQGMFLIKNLLLKKMLGKNIRGKNLEATISIIIFVIFIGVTILSAFFSKVNNLLIPVIILDKTIFKIIGLILMLIILIISAMTLHTMKDSWRVGVIDSDKTELVTSGIFNYSRNPYFLSYILMFISYTFIVPNAVLFIILIIAVISIHMMILKEEKYLVRVHGEAYASYKKSTGRYFLFL